MFDNNWNIIIAVLVIVLIFAYLCNNNEGFAGTVDAKNAEALGMVSSVYNKDNMSVTNLTATSTITIPGNNKITLNAADGNKILVDAPAGKAPFYINNGINMGCWNTWNINNDGNIDNQDDYLKNRRDVISHEINERDANRFKKLAGINKK